MEGKLEEVSNNKTNNNKVATLQTILQSSRPKNDEIPVIIETKSWLEETKSEPKEKYSTLRRLAIFEMIFRMTWVIMGNVCDYRNGCAQDVYFPSHTVPVMVVGTGMITLLKGYVSLSHHVKTSSKSCTPTCWTPHNHLFAITITSSMAKFLTTVVILRIMLFCQYRSGMQPAWFLTYSLNLVFIILVAWSALLQKGGSKDLYKNGTSQHLKLQLPHTNARIGDMEEVTGVQEHFDDVSYEKPPTYEDSLTSDHSNEETPAKSEIINNSLSTKR